MTAPQLWMVFDCESVGLYGETFAVGWVVVDRDGNERDWGRLACDPNNAAGDHDGRAWVAENCPPIVATHDFPRQIRAAFWNQWLAHKERGAVLMADCAWPVEARFLASCVDDDAQRTWEGPYPLHELASFMVAAGMDPMATYDRRSDEPQHDPLGDARQSARLLVSALKKLAGGEAKP